jgi:ubiquitin-like protein ATG12
MAHSSGSPDASTRPLPSWTVPEHSESFGEVLNALETYRKKDPSKGDPLTPDLSLSTEPCLHSVIVRFKAVGNAPIMKQNFYKITSSNRFQAVIQFLRKELGWQAGEPLVSHGSSAESYDMFIYVKFTYINLAFSPAPDDTVSNLFKVQRTRVTCSSS